MRALCWLMLAIPLLAGCGGDDGDDKQGPSGDERVEGRALCWALLWGKTTGNTINSVRGKLVSLKWWKISPFELIMFLYYGPLFLVIGVLNAGLTLAPRVPAWFSAVFGAILWLPQALHLFAAGVVSIDAFADRPASRASRRASTASIMTIASRWFASKASLPVTSRIGSTRAARSSRTGSSA